MRPDWVRLIPAPTPRSVRLRNAGPRLLTSTSEAVARLEDVLARVKGACVRLQPFRLCLTPVARRATMRLKRDCG
jgi:hypothetical protein